MKRRMCMTLIVLAFSVSFTQADDETVKHDAEVARQRAILDVAIAKQKADNAATIKAALDKADRDAKEKARDSAIDNLVKQVPAEKPTPAAPKPAAPKPAAPKPASTKPAGGKVSSGGGGGSGLGGSKGPGSKVSSGS